MSRATLYVGSVFPDTMALTRDGLILSIAARSR